MNNPLYIKVGSKTWRRENDDPNYYNVNGRMYFERIHISAFPADAIKEAQNKQTCFRENCCNQQVKVTIKPTELWYCQEEADALREWEKGVYCPSRKNGNNIQHSKV